jgi:transposase InsO family protein
MGCTPETLRQEPDNDVPDTLTTSKRQLLKELEREVRELHHSNDILRQASATAEVSGAAKLPGQTRCDAILMPEIQRLYEANYSVYGVCKVWRQLKREGVGVTWCIIERLMKALQIRGVTRGKSVRTTRISKAETPQDVELATLKWVDWYSNHRLMERTEYISPIEAERAYHASLNDRDVAA